MPAEESSGAGGAGLTTLSVASIVVTLLAALALRENGWNGWGIVALAAVLVGLVTAGLGVFRPGRASRPLAAAAFVVNALVGAGLLVWFARIVSGSA